MPVRIYIKPEELTGEHTLRIYKLFCKAYSITPTKTDKTWMQEEAPSELRQGFVDYRPYFGGKFFINKTGESIISHGYSNSEDPKQKEKDNRFAELVKKEFAKSKIKAEKN